MSVAKTAVELVRDRIAAGKASCILFGDSKEPTGFVKADIARVDHIEVTPDDGDLFAEFGIVCVPAVVFISAKGEHLIVNGIPSILGHSKKHKEVYESVAAKLGILLKK